MKKLAISFILLLITGIATTGAKYAEEDKTLEDMYNTYHDRKKWMETNPDTVSEYLKNADLLLKDYPKIDSVLYPLIRKAMIQYYGDSIPYEMSEEDFALCVETIATSEGSSLSKRGIRPFKSPLFLKGNNPFGMQGRGMTVKTFEYVDGVKKTMYLPFKRFESFDEAILALFDLFENKRYSRLRKSRTGKEFFYDLKRCGYFTSPHHHITFFIPHFNNLKELNR